MNCELCWTTWPHLSLHTNRTIVLGFLADRAPSLIFLEFKQFNQVTRWIFQKPGATGSRLADFSSEFGPASVQPADETVYVFRNNHQPVPSTRLRIAASSSSTTRPWSAQIERQIIANKRCELAGIVHVH